MGQQPATIQNHPTLWDGVVVLLVLCAAGLILWYHSPTEATSLEVVVTWNQKELGRYPLSGQAQPVTLTLDQLAYPLTLQIEGEQVCILESVCPGEDCVHTGWIGDNGAMIVCLPNQLMVSITGSDQPVVDGVTG